MSVTFQLKIPQIIIYCFEMHILSGSRMLFHACLFKCKWAAAPRPLFQNRALLYSSYLGYSAKNISLVLIIMSIGLKSGVLKPDHFTFLIYTVFWAHTSGQRAAVTWHVNTKLSSLSCLIVLKLSNTLKFMLKNTRVTKSVCEGKQLGKK